MEGEYAWDAQKSLRGVSREGRAVAYREDTLGVSLGSHVSVMNSLQHHPGFIVLPILEPDRAHGQVSRPRTQAYNPALHPGFWSCGARKGSCPRPLTYRHTHHPLGKSPKRGHSKMSSGVGRSGGRQIQA